MIRYIIMIQAWEKRNDEDSEAFEAFTFFRDLGAQRTVDLAFERWKSTYSVYRKQAVLKSYRKKFNRWYIDHLWRMRAESWDSELDRLNLIVFVESRKKMAEKHATIAAWMAEQLFLDFKRRQEAKELDQMPTFSLIKGIFEAMSMEQKARGIPQAMFIESKREELIDVFKKFIEEWTETITDIVNRYVTDDLQRQQLAGDVRGATLRLICGESSQNK